ncbi:MAG: 5'-nucleotidase C-terminal domain-containing protein [Prevotella sp.]|nr:5'-nucleotidase C-terminal domain-containing protein [Prevotella sp.]
MRKSFIVFVFGAVCLSGCRQHYELSAVSRTCLVVDSRYDVQADAGAVAFLAPYKQRVDSVMGPVLGEVAHDMMAVRPESDLSNLLTDILVYMSKDYGEQPDFGIYNMGGIRAALSKGKVTYGDVLDVAPFENKICFVTLTGEKVLELFSQIAGRGGEGVSRGVQLVVSRDGKLVSARLNGQPIDPARNYRVTTIDYLAQGNDGLKAFQSGTDLNSPQEERNNSRYVIADYFREMQKKGIAVDSKVEGRVKIED